MSTAAAPAARISEGLPELQFDLSTLAKRGYGSKHTNLAKIHAGVLPAQKIAGAWRIRESDLHLLVEDDNAA